MNKDLIPAFIKIAEKKHGELHKYTETEEVINWCYKDSLHKYYDDVYSPMINDVNEYIKVSGWEPDTKQADNLFGGYNRLTKRYFTVTYSKDKDKISLSNFESGYGYSPKRSRLYVVREQTPLLCFSKHIYAFKRMRVGKRWKYQPRIYTGLYYSVHLKDYLQEKLRCGDKVLELNVPYRFMKHCPGQSWAFINRYGFDIQYLMEVLKMTDTYNQMINLGGKKTEALCRLLAWRYKEGVMPVSNALWSTADFIHDRTYTKPARSWDTKDNLPF